jgi:hypothetical protein
MNGYCFGVVGVGVDGGAGGTGESGRGISLCSWYILRCLTNILRAVFG